MSVASLLNRKDYIGNGTVDTFAYDFKIFQNSDLKVTVRDPDTPYNQTILTLGTHYTVTGAGETAGGNVALVNGAFAWLDVDGDLDTNWKLTIRRVRVMKQETDFRNQARFYAELHEDEFDRHTMIEQQIQEEFDRTVSLPETVLASDFDPVLPNDIVGTISKVPMTNAAGDGWEPTANWPTADSINTAQASAAAAAASAAAAAASEAAAAVSAADAAASALSAAQNTTKKYESLGNGDGIQTSFGPLSSTPLDEDSVLPFLDGAAFGPPGVTTWSLNGLFIDFVNPPAAGQEVSADYLRRATILVPGAAAYTINGTTGAPVVVDGLTSIPTTNDAFHRVYVVSDGGPVPVVASPQVEDGQFVGQIVKITGTSDVDYPVLDFGFGPINLQDKVTVEIHWNGSAWSEDSRSS